MAVVPNFGLVVGREGTIDREPAVWLRFYDGEGNLVPLPEEAAQQYAQEERQRAEQEQQRAEQSEQRAEQSEQRAEQAEQRAERLAAQLRAMGIEPDSV